MFMNTPESFVDICFNSGVYAPELCKECYFATLGTVSGLTSGFLYQMVTQNMLRTHEGN